MSYSAGLHGFAALLPLHFLITPLIAAEPSLPIASAGASICDASTSAPASGVTQRAALMQRDSRLAPARTSAQNKKEGDNAAAVGGELSKKVQQANARRERALLRAMQARTAARMARERRLRLEAERAARLRARKQKRHRGLNDDDVVEMAEEWQHDVAKRRRAKNSMHSEASWLDFGQNSGQGARLFNPMVTMVFFLMSVPAGVVVASLGALSFVSLYGRKREDDSTRRSWSDFRNRRSGLS